MFQIIFLFFGILVMIYLIIVDKSENNNIISTPNIYPTDIQLINPMNQTNQINPINRTNQINLINSMNQTNPIKKQILWKNNKNRRQKRKT